MMPLTMFFLKKNFYYIRNPFTGLAKGLRMFRILCRCFDQPPFHSQEGVQGILGSSGLSMAESQPFICL